MLKDIVTIKLQGANFSSLTPLALFEPKEGTDKAGNDIMKIIKGTLLYGRNGSGKSTIAKAFRKASGEELAIIKHVSFLDKDGNTVNLTEDEKKRIFVFDEDYVNSHVRLKENHLDTIIMLGEAADLTDKIDIAEKIRDEAKKSFEEKEAAFKEYQDVRNPKSPKKRLWKIGVALKGDDGWAGRDRRINGGKQNTQVRDDTYEQFLSVTPVKTRSELIIEFERQMKALDIAKSGTSKIETKVPVLPDSYNQYDDDTIATLLARKIEKPELSEREQYLLGLVESGNTVDLSQKATFFRNPEVKHCPFCFQTLSDNYKMELVTSIEKVLSKVVSDHQKVLESYIYDDVIIDISAYSVLGNYESCKKLIEIINEKIQNNNKLIRQKIANPYEPKAAENLNILGMILQLDKALKKLEDERIDFNRNATDTRPIREKLNEINSHIAHYDIKDAVDEYEKQKEEYEKTEEAFKVAKFDYDTKKKAVEGLEAQRKNVQLAIDVINACLKYIFFAEDRLKIEYIDGEYRLFSHGKNVRPCDVSLGERNIIGLSYFFTSIMEGQEEKDVYGKEYLLVIDDPISSFDTENRIGILSFLKYKLSEFLEGNQNTKAFIMTHDLMTFYDVHKEFEEIIACCKKKGYDHAPKFNRFEMTDGTLVLFTNKRQEYTEIMKLVYNYGKGNKNELDIVIGNMMRQVLEAFSTFQYKKGIEDVSTDSDILTLLPEPEYQAYFKNLMYRLVLHGGSHKEEQIKTMKDYEFFGLISEVEKRRTAKEVICFIYLLNKKHVLLHLQDIKDVATTLDLWCNEIKARASLP